MADGDADSPRTQATTPWGRITVWALFLLFLASWAVGLIGLRRNWVKRITAYELSAASSRRAAWSFSRVLQQAYGTTWQDLEAGTGLKLAEVKSNGGRRFARVVEPQSGYEFTLRFSDGLLDHHVGIPLAVRPRAGAVHLALEEARQATLSFAALVWLAIVAEILVVPRWRRGMAEVALAVSLAFATAVALHPGLRMGVYVGGIHWSVIVAFLLVPASVLLVRLVRRERSTEPLCRGCGYNLLNNTSGVCPECGRVMSLSMREKVRYASRPRELAVPDLEHVRVEEDVEQVEEVDEAVIEEPPEGAAQR